MSSMEQRSLILCLGCGETFTFEEYQRHQFRAEHVDKGETWVEA